MKLSELKIGMRMRTRANGEVWEVLALGRRRFIAVKENYPDTETSWSPDDFAWEIIEPRKRPSERIAEIMHATSLTCSSVTVISPFDAICKYLDEQASERS